MNAKLIGLVIVSTLFLIGFILFSPFRMVGAGERGSEQDALTAKNQLERVKFEAEQRVTQAKAEAEAIKIQAQAITQQGGKDYVQLKAIEKWSGNLQTQMIPNGTLPFIDLTK